MSFAWHALPSFSHCDGLPKRTSDIAIQRKKTIGQFSLHFYSLSSFFPFRFASTYFTVINHPFRLPLAGAHSLHHVFHWGGVKNIKLEKCKVGVDSTPPHSTDFRNFFEIMIGIFVLRDFEQTCITYLPFITRGKWPKWARKSTKLKHGQNCAQK